MLDKIVLSEDRKSATVHYDTHSFHFYHSGGKVMDLVTEIVFWDRPISEIVCEKTEKIEIQLSFDMSEAA